MSKKGMGIAVVVILLILIAGVAPYFIGAKVETRFRDGIAKASAEYGYPIELTEYQRGWLHSHAVTRVQIEDQTFDIDHEITHGPLFVFGWAKIHSELPQDFTPEVAGFFDQSPLVADTRLGFGGGYRIDIESPAFDKEVPDHPGAQVAWQGLDGYYSRDGNQIELQLQGGGLKLDGPEGRIVVDDIRLSGDGSAMDDLGDGELDWDSRFEASLGRYQISDKDGVFDIAYGMRLHADTANGDNDTVELHAGYDITDLQINAQPDQGEPIDIDLDKAAIKLDLTGLNADPMEKAVLALRDIDTTRQSPEQAQALAGRVLMELAPKILAGTPKLTVTVPPLETGHGQARGKIAAGLIDSGEIPSRVAEATRDMPMLAMAQRLTLDANVFVDQQLIDWVADNLASERPAMARDLNSQIKMLVQQGFLMREDGAVGLKLHSGKDAVVLNGHEIPPRQLQSLLHSLAR
ncbi:YdgA family protein [uncultured Salinisphaera sp.]|uniref:YdgA family protein n=1 Tax=uncultured Salinisphaera sp. TaxID=359372 RepID=UPI0032B17C63